MRGDTVTLSCGKVLKLPYRDWVRPMAPAEYTEFKADVLRNGVTVAVTVDRDDNLIDGHHRVRAAWEMGIPWSRIPHVVVDAVTPEQVEAVIRTKNDYRRHLSREEIEEGRRQRDERMRRRVHRDGASYREVAKEEGVDHKTVAKAAQGGECSPHCASAPSRKRKTSVEEGEEVRQRVVAMRQEGADVKQISEETKLSPRTVQHHLKRAKEPRPGPSRVHAARRREEMKQLAKELRQQERDLKLARKGEQPDRGSGPAGVVSSEVLGEVSDILQRITVILADASEDALRAFAGVQRSLRGVKERYWPTSPQQLPG